MAGHTPTGDPLDEALALVRLSHSAIRLGHDPLGPPVRPWRRPLLWLKQQAHALAAYYANRLGQRQMVFNGGALPLLEHILAQHRAETARLQAQIAELSDRVRALEKGDQ